MKRLVQVLLAVLVVTATVAAPVAAASSWTSDTVGPSITEDMGAFGVYAPSEDVKRYGAEQYPGFAVKYTDGDAGKLEAWVNGSEDRTIRARNDASNWMLVSAPPKHVLGSIWALTSTPLESESYVDTIAVNRELGIDPIRPSALEDSGAWERPKWSRATELTSGGEFGPDGASWSEDVNRSSLADVRATVSADEVSVNGSGVRWAVLDTGLDYDADLHEDRVPMAANTITGETVVINDTANATVSDYDLVADGSSSNHGSWVATAIAGNGTGANATGVAPAGTLIPVKVLADDGSGSTQDIAEGIEYAASEADADIISMSLGSAVPNERINDAIRNALENEDVSAVVVAAGNSRMTYRYLASPGDEPGVVTVTATDAKAANESKSAYFSNVGADPQTGKMPTVGAPGMQITATTADGNVTLSGTSMATPVVSGLLGLTLEAQPQLEGNPAELREYLKSHAEPLEQAGETEVGAGRPDAGNLVDDVEPESSQSEEKNEDSERRDNANRALPGSWLRQVLG